MKIWQTYRNADDIEGRGPMVPDYAFLHKEHADRYIDEQPGVMGRRAQWSKQKFGDWSVEVIEVFDFDVIEAGLEKVKLRSKALSKLTPEEKLVLGLE
ncbi:hypothetical protein b3_0091 [Synechococcus phage B3]|nr:hypothetical protein b3_0091 [Synechococcus phage B3]QGT54705.1 hypothetical protein b23_0090 [Synechococcus phage B23]